MRQVKREFPSHGRLGDTTHEVTEPFATLNARIPRKLWHRMRILCVEEDRSMQEFVIEAVREHLSRHVR